MIMEESSSVQKANHEHHADHMPEHGGVPHQHTTSHTDHTQTDQHAGHDSEHGAHVEHTGHDKAAICIGQPFPVSSVRSTEARQPAVSTTPSGLRCSPAQTAPRNSFSGTMASTRPTASSRSRTASPARSAGRNSPSEPWNLSSKQASTR